MLALPRAASAKRARPSFEPAGSLSEPAANITSLGSGSVGEPAACDVEPEDGCAAGATEAPATAVSGGGALRPASTIPAMATTINTATATMTTVREELLCGGFFGSLMRLPDVLFGFAAADSSWR